MPIMTHSGRGAFRNLLNFKVHLRFLSSVNRRVFVYWLVSVACCLAVYSYGLRSWFQQDDFAWLGLGLTVHGWRDLMHALFAPMAQGTIRPWSERAFFMGLHSAFGLNALPYHLLVFLTQFLNLALIILVVRSLTRSAAAGFWASVLWTVNGAISLSLSWAAAYNQIQCSCFLLGALYLYIRYLETGNRNYYTAQWVVFLFGFGALETNIVYPVLAFGVVLCLTPKRWKSALPLFLASLVYGLIHIYFAKKSSSGVYGIQVGLSMWDTFVTYWRWALGPERISLVFYHFPIGWAMAGTVVLTSALLGFIAFQVLRRQWIVLFFLLWFVVTLGPVLPLRNHISDYYLTIPTIGLAMLGGWAFVLSWRAGLIYRAGGMALLAVYFAAAIPVAEGTSKLTYMRSVAVRNLVRGVERAAELHPGKSILLNDVSEEIFWNGIYDRPFRMLGLSNVYVSPESAGRLTPYPELGKIEDYTLPAQAVSAALDHDQMVVYSVAGARPANVTELYKSARKREGLVAKTPQVIPLADPLLQYLVGSGWYKPEGDFRWMPLSASLRVGGPATTSQVLHIKGFCSPLQLKDGPVVVRVVLDYRIIGSRSVTNCEAPFDLSYVLPGQYLGRDAISLTIETDRTIAPAGESRSLGLAVQTVGVY